jgi:hypothetical protein
LVVPDHFSGAVTLRLALPSETSIPPHSNGDTNLLKMADAVNFGRSSKSTLLLLQADSPIYPLHCFRWILSISSDACCPAAAAGRP